MSSADENVTDSLHTMHDTDLPTLQRYRDGMRSLSGAERLARAVALSALVRGIGAPDHRVAPN